MGMNIENKLFDEMVNRFEKYDNKILVKLKKRVVAYLANELVKKRGLNNIDEWRVIKKEVYKNSGLEELANYVVERYFEGSKEEKEELNKNLKKRFMDFIVKCYYPNFNVNKISGKLILDIYGVVSNTSAWEISTYSFQNEFKKVLTS